MREPGLTSRAAAPLPLGAPLVALLLAACGTDQIPAYVNPSGDGGSSSVGRSCNVTADCKGGFGDEACCKGVCVNTSTDPRHCGGCGMACGALPHAASVVCGDGLCGIGICESGYANCDGQVQSGCETDLTSDNANCGRCGGACLSGPHGASSCGGGRCNTTCDVPFADCDRNPATGCEVDLSSDKANCSSCGNACPSFANATGGCVAGHCGLGNCLPGFDNCDGNIQNGCETEVLANNDNCGGCGKVCGSANGTSRCSLGLCILRCNAGFADCDMNAANGCESSLGNDARNCGTCGKACPNGQACVAGQCAGGNLYQPVGPQVNIPVATLAGWSQCFVNTYKDANATAAQIAAMCPKAKLMLACRKVNANTLTLLAWAPRADVTFNNNKVQCMGGAFVPHQANGTGWYFDPNMSVGFAKGGDTVILCSCDTDMANPDQRLCWHASGGNLTGGYRCGSTINLNGDASWERVIYQAD